MGEEQIGLEECLQVEAALQRLYEISNQKTSSMGVWYEEAACTWIFSSRGLFTYQQSQFQLPGNSATTLPSVGQAGIMVYLSVHVHNCFLMK